MASEFSPPGQSARMTKSQIKKYIKNLNENMKIARQRLEEAKTRGEFKSEEKELKELEKILDEM